jgi:hypothetical protein
MATTHTLISSATVGSGGAASIEFTSIPATYTDLIVLTSTRSTRNSDTIDDLVIRFNDSTSSYSCRRLMGTGATVANDTQLDIRGFAVADNSTAGVFSNNNYYIPNYASSNYKFISIEGVNENNAATAFGGIVAGLWSNTSAITKITLLANNGNLMQYSTATLYGVSNS